MTVGQHLSCIVILRKWQPLSQCACVCPAQVAGNPLCLSMSCRLHLVHLLPQVSLLDGKAVTAKEKVLSSNMHGADAEGLRAIRRKYFPNGELDDGGGGLSKMLQDYMSYCFGYNFF